MTRWRLDICGFARSSRVRKKVQRERTGQSRASWVGEWQGLARGLRKRGHPKREGLSAGTSPAREVLPGSGLGGPCPPRAHLWGQGWELQVSTAAGCGASALHRERGAVLSRPPRASTQRTSRSHRPPPHEALQGPKSPASQLRRGTGHQADPSDPSDHFPGQGGAQGPFRDLDALQVSPSRT